MRSALLVTAVAAVVFVPSTDAASQVHVTYLGDAYAVTFASDSDNVTVRTDAGDVRAARVDGTLFQARLPPPATRYEIEGRAFDLAAPPTAAGTTRVAFVGDLGVSNDARAIVAAMIAAKPDLVLIGGDLSYAHGNDTVWAAWFELMEPLASRVPIMPAIGNHESHCVDPSRPGAFVACGLAPNRWDARFPLPGDGRAYAFDWGALRVVVLDSEVYFASDHGTNASEQADFLADSLAGDKERWDVVMFHRPLRTTSERASMENPGGRRDLAPILDTSADLVLQAHLHAYERSLAGENGTIYVTSGGGGRELYDEWGPNASWVAARAAEHHFVLLDVSPTRIDAQALRPDGSVLDSFTLMRPAAPPKPTPTPSPSPSPNSTPSPNPRPSPAPEEVRETPGGAWWTLGAAIALLARRRASITP